MVTSAESWVRGKVQKQDWILQIRAQKFPTFSWICPVAVCSAETFINRFAIDRVIVRIPSRIIEGYLTYPYIGKTAYHARNLRMCSPNSVRFLAMKMNANPTN